MIERSHRGESSDRGDNLGRWRKDMYGRIYKERDRFWSILLTYITVYTFLDGDCATFTCICCTCTRLLLDLNCSCCDCYWLPLTENTKLRTTLCRSSTGRPATSHWNKRAKFDLLFLSCDDTHCNISYQSFDG